jgi:glycosyltransferase involved in cell wall biosynthesis
MRTTHRQNDKTLMTAAELPTISVVIVTFSRYAILHRAIESVKNQTYKNIIVRVVNDDPDDLVADDIVASFKDDRISAFMRRQRRGAAKNFNLPFSQTKASFVSLLEDDNWWEPTFLEEMYSALSKNPDTDVAVGNETIWKELKSSEWKNTGPTIWKFRDIRTFRCDLESLCGLAKICNSSMLVRVKANVPLQTPNDIPVDVTEHFRERLFCVSILLLGRPLVNYAETLGLRAIPHPPNLRWFS